MAKRILVIGAHPDDETFGMGGTILKHTSKGDIVHVLIITDGSSSQYKHYEEMISKKKIEANNAMKILGVRDIQFGMLPDMKLDTVSHIEINRTIEKKIQSFKPTVVYTHHWGDVNRDHREVFHSTIVATRPNPSQIIRQVYTYETPSSTEWLVSKADDAFNSNVFVDITDFIEKKIKAINCYESEIRGYPHPRSPESIQFYAGRNGGMVGTEAAERFYLIREIK